MNYLFVMDPLEKVTQDKDTTFALIRAAQSRGHQSFHCLPSELSVEGGDCYARARKLEIITAAPFIHFVSSPEKICLQSPGIDAVFIRKDPPFDSAYLYATLLLERARGATLLINDPRGLRDANEKLYALNFAKWMTETIVTSSRQDILEFTRQVGGNTVIKPLDGAGGIGVMMLRSDDKNARAITDVLTSEGTKLAMVQKFIPRVTEGDKRILLLNGEPLGAILRVPRKDDMRSNIHVGGNVVATELTPHEQDLVESIAPRLRQDGLFFVGLDVIDGYLTEVNVTSPTGIQELSRFSGIDQAARVIEWVEHCPLS